MKKILLVTTSVVLATNLFTGCAVKTGNDKLQSVTEQNIDSFIVNGVSTKKDVQAKLGGATSVDFMQNGLEKWTYLHTLKVEKGINYVPVANWFVRGTNDTKKSIYISIFNCWNSKFIFSKCKLI